MPGQNMPNTLASNLLHPPDLDTKTLPRQGRAQETFERILSITAELLAEVGIERLSTNLICERAGLTPPALYRYFPNKYAVLHTLGERLMGAQNALLAEWATPAALSAPAAEFHHRLMGLFSDTVQSRPAGGSASCWNSSACSFSSLPARRPCRCRSRWRTARREASPSQRRSS
jgi:AcrR family transcriptional regulator